MDKNSKVKVLFASHFGEPWGGISIQNQLIKESNLSDLVTLKTLGTSHGDLGFQDRGKGKIANFKNALLNIFRFIKSFNAFKPDVVDIGTASGLSFIKHGVMALYAHYKGAKVIITFHCSKNKIFGQGQLYKRNVNYVLNRIDGIVAISKEWLDIEKIYTNLKVCYIPNAVNSHQFFDILKVEPYHKNRKINIFFIGHIQKEKGIYELIDAIKMLTRKGFDNFDVSLVGGLNETGEENKIMNYIKENKLENTIKIYPPAYGKVKLSFFQNADIMVLPSYHEGMPNVILEGMAAELPIVATNVGGIPDQVIHDKTGILVPPKDSLALMNALFKLIQNGKLRNDLGRAGRKRALEKFSVEKKVKRMCDFYCVIHSM